MHLEELFGVTPLARQMIVQRQVCDILGVDQHQRLVIIELKNEEDRYVLPQLTRYYSIIMAEKPFRDVVDYDQPIRLMAIAPSFHEHSLIDREYNRLHFEMLTFSMLVPEKERFEFELQCLDTDRVVVIDVPKQFHAFIVHEGQLSPDKHRKAQPPKSLIMLSENLSVDQRQELMALREEILAFDDRMIEVGRTVVTEYGLRKGESEIYKTKRCAEIRPETPGIHVPCLRVILPYAKREFGAPGRTYKQEHVKGLAWARIWSCHNSSDIFFYLGNQGSTRYSFKYSLDQYQTVLYTLTGQNRKLNSVFDLLHLALEEWWQQSM